MALANTTFDLDEVHDGVVRAAVSQHFLSKLMHEYGEDASEYTMTHSYSDSELDGYSQLAPAAPAAAPGRHARPSCESVAAFFRDFLVADNTAAAAAADSAQHRRPSVDDVASLLVDYVEGLSRRPSVADVSFALKNFINDYSQPGSVPRLQVMECEGEGEEMEHMDDSGMTSAPHSAFMSPEQQQQYALAAQWRGPSSPRSSSPHSTHSSPGCERRRMYPCPDCNRLFTNSSNMTRHRRIHTGDRPYLCEHCNLAFGNSSNRRKHERTCKMRKDGGSASPSPGHSPRTARPLSRESSLQPPSVMMA